jgi:hypothetical protein
LDAAPKISFEYANDTTHQQITIARILLTKHLNIVNYYQNAWCGILPGVSVHIAHHPNRSLIDSSLHYIMTRRLVMTSINSGYGASNYSNSLNNTSLQGLSSSASSPSASATQAFEKSMQGTGQGTASDMDISKLVALIEQFLKTLKGSSQTEGEQGGGGSCSGGGHAGNTGSSNGSEGSAGGAGSLGDKEGNGCGAISNTDSGRKGDEMGNGGGKGGKSSCKGKD